MYSNDMQEEDPWLPVRTVMEVGSRPSDGEERLGIAVLHERQCGCVGCCAKCLYMVQAVFRNICRKAENLYKNTHSVELSIIRTSIIRNVKYPNPHFLRSAFKQRKNQRLLHAVKYCVISIKCCILYVLYCIVMVTVS